MASPSAAQPLAGRLPTSDPPDNPTSAPSSDPPDNPTGVPPGDPPDNPTGVPTGAPPAGVADRLARLRALHVPESDADVRRRLAARASGTTDPSDPSELFAAAVARRLAELRALCALASYLHRRG